MLYDLCKQLKSCRDGQLTYPHCSWASLLEAGYQYLAHIILLLFILSRRKKSKQHALHDNLLFKAIIQYAMAHILQKSTILWTERQQPFLIHSITFSLIWVRLFYEHRFVVAWNIYSKYTPQNPTNWKVPTTLWLSKFLLNSGPLAFVQVNYDGTFLVLSFQYFRMSTNDLYHWKVCDKDVLGKA